MGATTTSGSTETPRRSFAVRAAIFVVLAGAGGVLCVLAGRELAGLRSVSWPVLIAVGFLLAGAWLLLSFAAAQISLPGPDRPNVAGAVHWLTMASIGLVVIAALGVAPGFAGPRQLGYVLLEDVGLALVAGLVLWAIGPVVGKTGYSALSRVGSRYAADWRRPRQAESQRVSPLITLLLRSLAVAFAGLCLSVGEQVVGSSGNPLPGNVANAYAPIGGWILGTAIAWRLTTPLFPTPGHHPSRHAVHGVGLTLLVSVVFLFVFASGAADKADGRLWNREADRAQPISVPSNVVRDDIALAAMFQPELRFEKGEEWFPTSVDWFLAQNTKPYRNGTACVNICYGLPCDDARGACADSGRSDPTVYVNVSRGKEWPDSSVPEALKPEWVLLQYWLFYNYDSLRMPVLTQWHQGDWEQITVALAVEGESAAPVFVAYSEHCSGVVLPWSLVQIGRGRTHPAVYVARGSHANYPRSIDAPIRQLSCSLDVKPPHYLGIGGLFFTSALRGDALEVPVGYVLGMRDRTGDVPGPAYRLRRFAPDDGIVDFHGFWGRDNNLQFWPGPPHAAGNGPQSPPDQGAWARPGQRMLCSKRWFSRDRPRCRVVLPPIVNE